MMSGSTRLIPLALSLVVIIWGSNSSPIAYLGVRYVGLLPLVFLTAKLGGHSFEIKKGTLKLLLAAAIFGFGIPQFLQYIGLNYTTAFASSLFGATTPLATLIICAAAGYEVVSTARWLGAFICIFGLAIFENAFTGQPTVGVGEMLVLSGALMAGIYNVLIARLVKDYHPIVLMFWIITLGAVFIEPFCITGLCQQNWNALTAWDWTLLAYSIVFPVIIAHPMWNWAIKHGGAGSTSLWVLLCPLVAGGLAAICLGTPILPHEIVGAIIALGGLAIAQFARAKLANFSLVRAHHKSPRSPETSASRENVHTP
jgi:drug/metabolite transporter (DMT)-like permease